MVVKTFIGKTQREVMSKARQEMGDDILLVESREIDGPDGKGRFVQIVVADKGKNANGSHTPARENYQEIKAKLRNRLDKYQDETLRRTADTFMPDSIHNGVIPPHLSGWRVNVYKELNALGVMPASSLKYILELSPKFFAQFPSLPATRTIVEHIARQQIRSCCRPSITVEELPRIIALVGPTGVGKTTTIMKMVSSPDVFASERVGIITTDVYRIGGTAALKAFGDISQVEISRVRDGAEMQEAIQRMSYMDRIIIDTPGRSPFFPGYIKELIATFAPLKDLAVLLALSLSTSLEDLFLDVGLYLPVGLSGVIVTKFDETSQGGKILSLLEEIHLPMYFICNGQGIPHDIQLAVSESVFNNIFKKVGNHGSINK